MSFSTSDLSVRIQLRTFLLPLVPAAVGGAVWDGLGLPLGWLMGSAVVVGVLAFIGMNVSAPKTLQSFAHATVGAGVGLALTPEAAAELVSWAPLMAAAACLGILLAVAATPLMVRGGGVSPATAFFSLLPGGVIEMANIGETHGADRTTIAALHALRVGMIVLIIPLTLFALSSSIAPVIEQETMASAWMVIAIIAVGLAGGWIAHRFGMPAPFLLGSILAVGALSTSQVFGGTLPQALSSVAQVIIGFALGAKFQRESLRAIPRALAVAALLLGLIMALMALVGVSASWMMPESAATLVLCFSIGGMAEMLLTAKTLGQNAAMIAAFQVMRAIIVNMLAGPIWARLSQTSLFTSVEKG